VWVCGGVCVMCWCDARCCLFVEVVVDGGGGVGVEHCVCVRVCVYLGVRSIGVCCGVFGAQCVCACVVRACVCMSMCVC
jgi:hypothetical protein